MRSQTLDRAAIQELFELQRRAAITLLTGAGAEPSPGLSLEIGRRELIAWVEQITERESGQLERRRNRTEELSRSISEVQAIREALAKEDRRQVHFPLIKEVLSASCASLPSSIKLEPGRITIDIRPDEPQLMAETACQLLYALGAALASDFASFEERVLRPLHTSTAEGS